MEKDERQPLAEGLPKEKQSALLSATETALSVCTFDPHSGSLYALVEPQGGAKGAASAESQS